MSNGAASTIAADRQTWVGSGGLELIAEVGGDPQGLPIVLLHGGGQTRHSWSKTGRLLGTRGYRVINLDLRGHGESAWAPDGDYRLDTFAADLAAVVAELHAPPVLIGASLGGATSLMLAGRDHAPPLHALVLVDIVPDLNQTGSNRIESFLRSGMNGFASIDEAAAAVAAYKGNKARAPSANGLKRNLRVGADSRYYWHWDPRFIDGPQAVADPKMPERLQHAAAKVRCPVLLVRGGESDLTDAGGVHDLRRLLPDLEVAEVSGATHMVVGDLNDEFNGAILAFLERRATRT